MANRSLSLMVDQFIKGRGPVKPRAAALLLMIAGALGFIISLITFGEQVLCLMGSTLLVFGGLAIHIIGKRHPASAEYAEESGEELEQSGCRSTMPPDPWRGQQTPVQAPAPSAWVTLDRETQTLANPSYAQGPLRSADVLMNELTRETIDVLRRQGADVHIDNQREERSILHIVSPAGKGYSILIDAGTETIDVSDVRALNSLMVSTGSEGAILVSANSFTTQAEEWAQKRSIVLVDGNRVDQISI
ncbi:MAG: restriction endonuclease [Anaerolineaceae bacterium]|nr:restriction endonuclease [Anaerolineaceae bacterium]